MNNLIKCILAIALIPIISSCSNNETKKETAKEIGKQQCYVAIDGTDTAFLALNITESGKIDGNLQIKYTGKEQNNGTVEGKYSGDTLIVDYTFKVGTTNKTIYKNPLAFLKKDQQLVLGVGQIETTLGRSYFVKGEPINFERGKFVFDPATCQK